MTSGPINTGALTISDYLLFCGTIAYIQFVAINQFGCFSGRLSSN